MKHVVLLATLAVACSWLGQASAGYPLTRLEQRIAGMGTKCSPWNGPYYSPEWGAPAAVLVPPTVWTASSLGSTVGGSHTSWVTPQFNRDYPAGSSYQGTFQPAPVWPSDTRQMGYYYIRGPWR